MEYTIEKWDDLYCVYKQERTGQRIIGAYETKEEAIEAIKGGTK